MVQLPRRDVVYPVKNTGRQSTGHPPAPTPDDHLRDIISTHLHGGYANPAALALSIQAAGYTRPTPVTTLGALAGLHPRDILRDRDGAPWSAASISNEDYERHGPWHLIAPAPQDIISTQ